MKLKKLCFVALTSMFALVSCGKEQDVFALSDKGNEVAADKFQTDFIAKCNSSEALNNLRRYISEGTLNQFDFNFSVFEKEEGSNIKTAQNGKTVEQSYKRNSTLERQYDATSKVVHESGIESQENTTPNNTTSSEEVADMTCAYHESLDAVVKYYNHTHEYEQTTVTDITSYLGIDDITDEVVNVLGSMYSTCEAGMIVTPPSSIKSFKCYENGNIFTVVAEAKPESFATGDYQSGTAMVTTQITFEESSLKIGRLEEFDNIIGLDTATNMKTTFNNSVKGLVTFEFTDNVLEEPNVGEYTAGSIS